MIDIKKIAPVSYCVGKLPMGEGRLQPIYLKMNERGWYIHAGELFLGQTDMGIEAYKGRAPDFFYKNGTAFKTIESAMGTLSDANLKHNMKIIQG